MNKVLILIKYSQIYKSLGEPEIEKSSKSEFSINLFTVNILSM